MCRWMALILVRVHFVARAILTSEKIGPLLLPIELRYTPAALLVQ